MIDNDLLFHSNEVFIIITGALAYIVMLRLPKQFTRQQTIIMLLISIYLSALFDNTLCVHPFNFYYVNNTSIPGFWDLMSYLMFGPFAYLFVYIYSILKKNRATYFIYIVVWAIVALFAEALAWHAGVYRYQNGYQMFFSLPIYLLVLTVTMIYYYSYIHNQEE
ncbi:hypothetical protein ACFP7A_10000 [Sporolactobacillus kofuensis]|uniref:Histidine kinase N-terminal 7TM region domain-containing protein n=1 Tax=Sporolactobacillus kofuensis TaxID=269672 RepID=A0ABW1WII5_9BACL|nr:hypothetical protein [Sporolactobacillus kofuensis]MCO7176207.1 hypothetical protein [Sporolactobacillus kofuensis]